MHEQSARFDTGEQGGAITIKASDILENYTGTSFDETTKHLFDEYSTFIDFTKRTIIFLEGDNTTNLYFIIKGLVRSFYIDEKGNDITKSFAAENDFFSTKGLITNIPSLFNVECLEDCKCIRIPYMILIKIMEKNNNIFKIFNQHLITAIESLEIRTRDLVMKSAEERYSIFLEQYPGLVQRINQKYIASYIGIRTGSLSRIIKHMNYKN